MKYYFIDLENVNSAGVHGAEDLTKDSVIYIFYSRNANSINLEAVSELTKSKAVVLYRKLSGTGQNALDFELVSIMSATIGDTKEGEYYIISNDKGYTAAIKCLMKEFSDKNVSIHQASSIANTQEIRERLINKHMTSVYKEQLFDSKLHQLLSESKYECYTKEIRSIVLNTCEKQQLYATIIDKFGFHLGAKIYRAIKSNYYELRDAI